MVNKRLEVLRAMSTITHSTDMDEFLRIVGLTSKELVDTLKELAEEGFVTKTKHGYSIDEKGRLALEADMTLPDDKKFYFFSGLAQPTGLTAGSIKEFYEIVKNVDILSIEFHLKREDFENWIKTAVKDEELANKFKALRQNETTGEPLRNEIIQTLESRFDEEILCCEWT